MKKTDRASSLCSSTTTTTLGWTPRWTCPRDCMLAELKVLVHPGMAVQRLNPVNYGVPKLGWRRPTREKGIRWDVVVFLLKMVVVFLFLYSFNSSGRKMSDFFCTQFIFKFLSLHNFENIIQNIEFWFGGRFYLGDE